MAVGKDEVASSNLAISSRKSSFSFGKGWIFLYLSTFSADLDFWKCVLLWHNKDKSENPCSATGWLACPYSFSTKNDPQMGSAGGDEKPGLHLKDKFY